MPKPRLSPAQRRIVDAMLEGDCLTSEHVNIYKPDSRCGNIIVDRRTIKSLVKDGVIEVERKDDVEITYRLAPEWRDAA